MAYLCFNYFLGCFFKVAGVVGKGNVKYVVNDGWLNTGISGFDKLLEKGIPMQSNVLIVGDAGSGKTIFGLQLAKNLAGQGKACFYMAFDEHEEKLFKYMKNLGWDPEALAASGKFLLKGYDLTPIISKIELLLIDKGNVNGILGDEFGRDYFGGFKPEVVIIDSLSSAFAAVREKEQSYRAFVHEFFRFLNKLGVTSFLITEASDLNGNGMSTGVEAFLADGVIMLYHARNGNVRERAIEIVKLRGSNYLEKVVPMRIESGKGIVVYTEEEMFKDVKGK